MFHSTLEIQFLVQQFEDRSLPIGQWNHKAQIAIACWLLLKDQRHAAERLKAGILALHSSQHILPTQDNGYHETRMLFWMAKVQSLIDVCEGPLLPVINTIVQGLANPDLVFFHYSPARLQTPTAQSSWCPPNRHPLSSSLRPC